MCEPMGGRRLDDIWMCTSAMKILIYFSICSYIRAVGFLYLRYVCAPAQLWDWLGYYLDEEEEVNMASGPKPQLM
jgi:pre-mRNA-splicing factor 38B